MGPAERVTLANAGRYIADLQAAGNSPYTVLGRVRDLFNAMKALAPEEDWGWLRGLIKRLHRVRRPVRNKRALVVSSYLILSFGLELMAEAEGPGGGSMFACASRYRDGLMIALLAARPLMRRRNSASIEIGRHLLEEGSHYCLRFEGTETKTGAPIDDLVPADLTPYLERYLTYYRLFPAGRTGRWKSRRPYLRSPGMSLWVSTYCSAMSGERSTSRSAS